MRTEVTSSAPRTGWPPPWLFILLPISYGVHTGYIQTALPWFLRHIGYSVDSVGAIVGLILSPMAFYFLWSPITDFGLRRRTWNLIASAGSALLMAVGILVLPAHVNLGSSLLFVAFSVCLLTTTCGGVLLAITQTGNHKSRAAAWLQGGSLTAQALGGGLLLYCSKHFSTLTVAISAAILVFLPAAPALTIPEPPPQSSLKGLPRSSAAMGREIIATLFSLRSLPGLLLLLAPVGTGAAQSLFSAMARDYQVGAKGVMLLNGALGAVLNMAGAYAAVIVPAHWDRRVCYAAAGLTCAVSGVFLTVAPLTPLSYFAGVAAYMLTTGASFGFFMGVVMITLGEAGLSGSSRYAILVSLGNLPIVYMTFAEGRSYALFGMRGVPAIDALGNTLVAVGTIVWITISLRRRRASTMSPARAAEGQLTTGHLPAGNLAGGAEAVTAE